MIWRSRRLVASIFQSTLPTRGSDFNRRHFYRADVRFQSTLPTRGSDARRGCRCPPACHFNPRSPRGGATHHLEDQCQRIAISIHAPHEGERLATLAGDVTTFLFQSTLPTRGSDPQRLLRRCGRQQISIHAPHEGERRASFAPPNSLSKFQSTLPTRGSDSGKVHLYAAFQRIC